MQVSRLLCDEFRVQELRSHIFRDAIDHYRKREDRKFELRKRKDELVLNRCENGAPVYTWKIIVATPRAGPQH